MFKDQNIVFFGANSAQSKAIASKLSELGANLTLTSRDITKLEQFAASINATSIQCDASDFKAVEEVFKVAEEKNGAINAAVNCAGSLLLKSAHMTREAEYNAVIQANLTTAFAVTRAACKAMLRSGGSILLFSSAAGKIGLANHEAIAAAKAGIIGLVKTAAASYASNKIRVNAIAPGLVEAAITESLLRNEMSRKFSEAMHPIGRVGSAEDIVDPAILLLNPKNDWITGETISVDGGLARVKPKIKA